MNSLSSISMFISFFLLFHCLEGKSLIQHSCEKAAKSDPNLSDKFCVACLEANPRNKTGSLEKLVTLSIELTMSNATNIATNISKLLKGRRRFDKHVRIGLQDCLELYMDAIPALKAARHAFLSKDFNTANIDVNSAMDASSTCEDGFKQMKREVSPLTKDNNIFFQLTAISLAFINMCH
jgi:pectinesterase inhibitor-like protein